MEIYPKHEIRKVHCLDGDWDFAWLGEAVDLEAVRPSGISFAEKRPVPSAFDAAGAYGCRRGTVALRRRVKLTPGCRSRLHFQGLGMWARIFVDGQPLLDWSAPYSGFWVEVPTADGAERELLVLVDNRFDARRVPLQMPFFDFYAYGGIYRSVAWHEVPDCWLERVQVTTADPAAGRISARVLFGGQCPAAVDLQIAIDGKAVFTGKVSPAAGTAVLDLCVPDPKPWSPATPNLHLLQATIPGDDIIERFGLRTVETRGGRVLLNGREIKLLGYCRHEAHPDFGPALPEAQMRQDLELLRDLGCNFIRGSHYSQNQRFLDLCDEQGFLVKEESLGWGQSAALFENPELCAGLELQTRLMVRNSFNHPCVIVWGFLNEGESDAPAARHIYQRLAGCIREEDRSRLVAYATCRPMTDLNYDLCDLVCVNTYPGWYNTDPKNPDKVPTVDDIWPWVNKIRESVRGRGFGDKPFLLTEIGAGAIPGWHDPYASFWSEEYQAKYLETVCRGVVADAGIAGLALWQFCDCRTYNTHRALGRPRAFNNKGTVDERRRPKLAYARVKECFSKAKKYDQN